ncbi:MAG TPA: hypothetical protein VE868_13630 [Balneolaceae bacterium]|nr:hypothetical protein [Balneolaceae bacterium]
MNFNTLSNRIAAFFKTKRGKNVLKWSQRFVNTAVLGWLIYQLSTIGWEKFWQSLPTNPLFYVLFLFIFLQLPLFEVFIYRITWKFEILKSIPIFILKRVYNKDVMGYSGELYFFVWAKKTLKLRSKEIFNVIKDNNIISSVASTFLSIALLAAFLFTGQIKIIRHIASQNRTYFIAGVILVIIIIALFIKFRHYVISMSLQMAYKIFGIQLLRMLLGQFVNLLMFYIVLPDVPLYIWFTFIAAQIIISRIPFLPSRDFIFAGLSISMAGSMAISQQAIAGIVITKGVLNKIGGAASFGITYLLKETELVPEPEPVEDDFNLLKKEQNVQ